MGISLIARQVALEGWREGVKEAPIEGCDNVKNILIATFGAPSNETLTLYIPRLFHPHYSLAAKQASHALYRPHR